MPDKKLTDKEIVKALECCKGADTDCWECELFDCCKVTVQEIMQYALDLINRKDQENESLKADVERLSRECFTYKIRWAKATARIETAKAEAYKEFAEAVKKDFDNPNIQKYGLDYVNFLKGIVDRRLKESVGE